MLSTNDFVLQYDDYTDEQLYHIHLNSDGYSPEAQEAVKIVIDKKGGLDKLTYRVKNRYQIANEINRIGTETVQMLRKNVDIDFLRTTVTSTILTPDEVQNILDNAFVAIEKEKQDKAIKPRTVIGSLLATVVSTIVGSILWALKAKYMPGPIPVIIFYLFIAGLVLICYGIIRSFTRQSKKNVVVLTATVISVLMSILIGYGVAPLL